MIDKILLNILSSTLFISSSLTPAATEAPKHVFTQVLPVGNYVIHSVEKDEALSTIAFKHYGDEDYWKVIWKDNSWIEDPNVLEEGLHLRINIEKPELSEEEPVMLATEVVMPQVQSVSVSMPTVAPVTPAPQVSTYSGGPLSEEAITYLGSCEAGNDPTKNTGNGYYGAFQFSACTWNSMGTGYARADLAPYDVQKAAVQQLLSRSSIYTQFPGCARKMQSAGLI